MYNFTHKDNKSAFQAHSRIINFDELLKYFSNKKYSFLYFVKGSFLDQHQLFETLHISYKIGIVTFFFYLKCT